jgi:hypothetical protein
MRSYLLDGIGWAFSFTALIFVYAWIEKHKFNQLGYMMYPSFNFKKLSDLEMVTDLFNQYIRHIYYWLLLALPVDIVIRKLLKKYAK